MKNGHYEPPDAVRPSLGGTEPFDALFERARRDAFTPEESERLWQSVVAAGPGGDAGPDIPGPSPGWRSGAALKTAAAFVVAGGLLAAAFAARRSGPREPGSAPGGAPVETAPRIEAPRVEGGPPTVSLDDLPRVQGEARPAAQPPRGRNPSAHPPEPLPGVESDSTGEATVAAAPVETSPAPVSSAAPALAPSEGALLLRARQQLASDPASALALTEEAGGRYPGGALAPEREVLAIEALARLGRLPSARSRFAAFRAAYPQSPHLARLASLVTP